MIPTFACKIIEKSCSSSLMSPVFFKFAIVGAITTALDFVVFGALTESAGVKAALANVLSYSCGIVVSFSLNRVWTFGSVRGESPLQQEAMKFIATHVAGLTLSTLLVFSFNLLLPAMFSKAISVPIVFAWNFLLAKLWVFK